MTATSNLDWMGEIDPLISYNDLIKNTKELNGNANIVMNEERSKRIEALIRHYVGNQIYLDML